jgi:diketogulonate reductase-like aldo/keto reductase
VELKTKGHLQTVALPSGEQVPAFGMGTWHLGERPDRRAEEIATLRLGLDLGARLVDTAEMYGDGESERLIAEAIGSRRGEFFLVSKVLPHHASRHGAAAACENSLRRLGTDRIDLYLLHWGGPVPIAETIEAFSELQQAGKIRYYGVSNLDLAAMRQVWSVPGGENVATDQLLYNLARRGIEWDLLPWLRERAIPVMAYSPIEQAKLSRDATLIDFAHRHGMTAAQAALAWLLAQGDVIVIPKAARRDHLRENFGALDHSLSASQLAELDRLFAPPSGPHPLEMI